MKGRSGGGGRAVNNQSELWAPALNHLAVAAAGGINLWRTDGWFVCRRLFMSQSCFLDRKPADKHTQTEQMIAAIKRAALNICGEEESWQRLPGGGARFTVYNPDMLVEHRAEQTSINVWIILDHRESFGIHSELVSESLWIIFRINFNHFELFWSISWMIQNRSGGLWIILYHCESFGITLNPFLNYFFTVLNHSESFSERIFNRSEWL